MEAKDKRSKKEYANNVKSEKETHKPFAMALKTLLVENLDGDRKRLKPYLHILVNVAFIHSPKTTFTENVICAEALGYGLELVQREGDYVSIEHRILPRFF